MSYLLNHPGLMWQLTQEHLAMVGMTLGMAVVLAVPLALLVHHVRWLALPVMGILSILYTVPSLALIILLVPWLGLNARSVVVAMVIYTQVILVRHFCVGLRSVEPAILEAAKGMGMNLWQRWWQVQVPLMLPIVLAGLRLAAIVAIAIATVGAKFGGRGTGNPAVRWHCPGRSLRQDLGRIPGGGIPGLAGEHSLAQPGMGGPSWLRG